MNYAYAELDLDKRNPFSKLFIKGEGEDSHKRGTFTKEQLEAGYDKALASGSAVKLLMPLLGETGCRLSEIVGAENRRYRYGERAHSYQTKCSQETKDKRI